MYSCYFHPLFIVILISSYSVIRVHVDRAPVGLYQRLCNWYLLLIR